ncbi:Glyoxalase superfamily enzyme, possibly 3-demethylubiquinone-9 3-methyltransferase [Reichenbachiella faecimaris]|uniref:Glyoxalase superfamily enzyme, possibly 3-demethylubiquinone-9 3-methyltransferase n=1 Tax=Reichenbachiella faecimaris TaxID=692418 RepID=A0A1W2G8S4_REIFA|nr:VOC family protein [Reichenbachiella faecimaris]SMD33079.1 Glyoxalase superfamily enzyme, possibly 3-demethylubiquinone-9 3-methyltransferase [Reichenbachiella faecimaris]
MSVLKNQKITPFLWFDKNSEEAIHLYTSIFPNSEIKQLKKWPANGPYPAETIQMATFLLDGVQFHAFDAGPQFKFNEAISLFVTCRDQQEVDHYWERLTADGGRESMCGWLKDKFGISWQIVPEFLIEKLSKGDPTKVNHMTQALYQMKKLIVADLEKAYNN